MNRFFIVVVCVVTSGCASASRQQQVVGNAREINDHIYEPIAASALAFDSPLAPPYELLGLERDAREAGAFIGYQETITEYFASGSVDNQSTDPFMTTYDRWSVSERTGVRYR